MTQTPDQKKLIAALLRMFNSARGQPVTVTAEVTSQSPVAPKACAFLLSTGHILGAIAINPVSFDNLDAEDAVQMAADMAKTSPFVMGPYDIVAVAMTAEFDKKSGRANEEDIPLYEQSLSDLTNLKAEELLLVDPNTEKVFISTSYNEFRFVS